MQSLKSTLSLKVIDLTSSYDTFMSAQLAYAKSKLSKQAQQMKVAYKKSCYKKGSRDE